MKMKLDILGFLAGKLVIPRCSAVIVASGNSTRMKGIDKVMTEISGQPMILRTVAAFQKHAAVQEIVVVTREDLQERVAVLLKDAGMTKVTAVAAGGNTRMQSVENGLVLCDKKSKLIAVHDGARPLISQEIITAVLSKGRANRRRRAGIAGERYDRYVEGGIGVFTPEQGKLYAMQTPQVFDADLIRAATERALQLDQEMTDDCAAVEAIGMKVSIVHGGEENLKVTTRMDLALARAIAGRYDSHEDRTGI